jgi:hypothetical protein
MVAVDDGDTGGAPIKANPSKEIIIGNISF